MGNSPYNLMFQPTVVNFNLLFHPSLIPPYDKGWERKLGNYPILGCNHLTYYII